MQGVLDSEPIPPSPGPPPDALRAPVAAPPGLRGAGAALDAAKRSLVSESRVGRLVEVRTGHYIHQEDVDTVVAEILRMIDAVRAGIGSAGSR